MSERRESSSAGYWMSVLDTQLRLIELCMVREIPETMEGSVGSGRFDNCGEVCCERGPFNFVRWPLIGSLRGFRFGLVALTCKALT